MAANLQVAVLRLVVNINAVSRGFL